MYSNAKLDGIIQKAITTVDDDKHKAMEIEAMEIAVNDEATSPVVALNVIWAGCKDKVSSVARHDEEPNVLQMKKP
ncbi:MAG: hypothetical protein NTZ14_02690 [Hyphomicrobiales bacterium]|nr:hypothetical protein [Hyphomicrobiales bacterium]